MDAGVPDDRCALRHHVGVHVGQVLRDQHETQAVIHRVDEARIDRFLAEHDPFNASPLG